MNVKQTTLIATLIALTLSTSVLAQPQNPSFDDDPTGCSGDPVTCTDYFPGWNTEGIIVRALDAVGRGHAVMLERQTDESTGDPIFGRGLDRISQTFPLPSDAQQLAFRYKWASDGGQRLIDLPPDAFLVRLFDNQGAAVASLSAGLGFTDAVYYEAADRTAPAYNSGVVMSTLNTDDGYRTVSMNVASLAGTNVTLEFGFAYSDNNETSMVILGKVGQLRI